MNTKPLLLSKTFIFNIIALVVIVAMGFGYSDHQVDSWVEPVAGIVVTVVNIILRLVTKLPINLSGK